MYTDKPFPNVNYFDSLQWLLTDNEQELLYIKIFRQLMIPFRTGAVGFI